MAAAAATGEVDGDVDGDVDGEMDGEVLPCRETPAKSLSYLGHHVPPSMSRCSRNEVCAAGPAARHGARFGGVSGDWGEWKHTAGLEEVDAAGDVDGDVDAPAKKYTLGKKNLSHDTRRRS